MNLKDKKQSSDGAEVIEKYKEKLERIAKIRGITVDEAIEQAVNQWFKKHSAEA
jgi:Ribbon-helix-helix protein, copG family